MATIAEKKTLDMRISPLGRVEGDLDLRVSVRDGVVTSAWTEAAMFRGFEIILKGKDPQAGLIVTPRICGICGGSHLTKAVYALDTAWGTEVPPNATLVRNIAQACETLQSIPRWFYALFAIDLTNKNYAQIEGYDEAVRRFAPFVGTSYEHGVTTSGKPVEIYAIFGGQWPHSSFMVPGGVMCGPTLSDVTRAISILEYWKDEWLEKHWLGCSVDRWLENKTWQDVLAWVDENESHYNSDCGFFIRFAMKCGLDTFGQGCGNFLATGTYFNPEKYGRPTIDGRNAALINRSGVYANGSYYDFDQANVREDISHSFYQGNHALHPFDGRTEPIDPADGHKQGKYSWAKSPRYEIPGMGHTPLEAGPLSRQVMAGKPGAEGWQDFDPLFHDAIGTVGPSVLVRVMARMHEAAKYYKLTRGWLDQLNLHEKFYIKPKELADGRGFGSTEAARGSLSDWIVIKDGKIENYQVVTPTAWNIGPRDGKDVLGPMEQAFIGTKIADTRDPVELGHVARSFDSCLVCTVHAYDEKTGQELSRFQIGGVC
ncbi:nickel-dependent hydrogenase large subunit [Oscillochloris sp. ZM17-4]|uniref:nickel-dependent hydrogenase large subunit n=1 Tax=Oscillochloris sp. ZM17-4 TaxID=2866714 RepID=UPI001C72F7FB|nr:nickel-dependent hydrogenase large subunit [Oscillochloris sp. ZM17-4]MBX0329186.1 nickel-dependent hydrogenase large subunit [Oscillochloris sp. ZM17-4]